MALLVGVVSMIVAVAGAALIGPGAASAAPEDPNAAAAATSAYPAPPPSVTVNAGSVTPGRNVRVSGMGFGIREPVLIDVVYRIIPGTPALRPPFGSPGGGVSRADADGNVRAHVALTFPGYATITLKGLRSHKTARVTVRVVAWGGKWPVYFRPGTFNGPFGSGGGLGAGAFGGAFGFGDGFPFGGKSPGAGPISYQAGPSELMLVSHQQPAPSTPAGAELLAGALGLVGLMGSAFVAVRSTRRPKGAVQ